MMLRFKKAGYALLACLFLTSCVHFKQVPLFQDLPQRVEVDEAINNYSPVILQNNDIVNVIVTSMSPEASAIFNPPMNQQQAANINSVPQNPVNLINNPNPAALTTSATPYTGYLIDMNGDIRLPLLGAVHIAGMTTAEARTLIAKKLETYLKEPVVSLRIVNFKIAVFGDVNAPGFYSIANERITLMEALITAGGLKIGGVRNNVLLVREIDGKRKFTRFDLNSRSTFTSPYFYLRSNDLIYVQEGVQRDRRDNIVGNLSIVVSTLTLILILFRL